MPSEGNGPSVDFELRTKAPNVKVRIVVYQDSVQVVANQAPVMIELVRPESHAEWWRGRRPRSALSLVHRYESAFVRLSSTGDPPARFTLSTPNAEAGTGICDVALAPAKR
jgi:hypothetical protein